MGLLTLILQTMLTNSINWIPLLRGWRQLTHEASAHFNKDGKHLSGMKKSRVIQVSLMESFLE